MAMNERACVPQCMVDNLLMASNWNDAHSVLLSLTLFCTIYFLILLYNTSCRPWLLLSWSSSRITADYIMWLAQMHKSPKYLLLASWLSWKSSKCCMFLSCAVTRSLHWDRTEMKMVSHCYRRHLIICLLCASLLCELLALLLVSDIMLIILYHRNMSFKQECLLFIYTVDMCRLFQTVSNKQFATGRL